MQKNYANKLKLKCVVVLSKVIFELKNWLDWWFKKVYLWFTVSTISELIIDFNPINGEQAENAMIEMLENNHHIETLSCTLCSFNQTFCKFLLPVFS